MSRLPTGSLRAFVGGALLTLVLAPGAGEACINETGTHRSGRPAYYMEYLPAELDQRLKTPGVPDAELIHWARNAIREARP